MKQVFYNSNGTRYKRALAWKQVFYNSNGTRYKRALAWAYCMTSSMRFQRNDKTVWLVSRPVCLPVRNPHKMLTA